ncbi:MAG: nuclear transport factor 2 family protein [Solirubrobacteraceae bacterium]
MPTLQVQLETGAISDPAVGAFPARYTAAWAHPTAERLAGFWTHDGELTQVGMATPIRGRDAIAAFQDGVLKLTPDLRVRPLAAAKNGETLFIHYRCEATLGGTPTAWEGFDRFELDGTLARRGPCIFDTAPIREALGGNSAHKRTSERAAGATK